MYHKTIKGYWVCFGENLYPDFTTISYTKKDSIKKCVEGSSITWDEYRKRYGWKCIKMDITFVEQSKK